MSTERMCAAPAIHNTATVLQCRCHGDKATLYTQLSQPSLCAYQRAAAPPPHPTLSTFQPTPILRTIILTGVIYLSYSLLRLFRRSSLSLALVSITKQYFVFLAELTKNIEGSSIFPSYWISICEARYLMIK